MLSNTENTIHTMTHKLCGIHVYLTLGIDIFIAVFFGGGGVGLLYLLAIKEPCPAHNQFFTVHGYYQQIYLHQNIDSNQGSHSTWSTWKKSWKMI